jgi:uncharacterized protein YkwD
MIKLQYFALILTLLAVSGCSAPSLTRSVAPIVEPALDQLTDIALASSLDEVELLTTGNAKGIELAGLVNTYRGEQGLPLTHWDARLFQVAVQRANELAMSLDCWSDTDQCDRTATLTEFAESAGYATDGVLLESAFITVGSSLNLDHCAETWQSATPHQENLTFKEVEQMGVAIVGVGNIRVYVLVLGRE